MAQGMPGLVEGMNNMFLIDKQDIPVDRCKDVTYGRVVVDYLPDNIDPYLTRLNVGGDGVNYPGDCGTPTVSLTTVNLLLNSIISKINAHFITIDIKDFYLNTPMARSEYIRLKLNDLPKSMVQTIQSGGKINQGRVCARGDLTRHVWSPAIGAHRTATSRKKSQQAVISAEQDHTRTLYARLAPDMLITMRR